MVRKIVLFSLCFVLLYNTYSQRNPMWAAPVATNFVYNFYQVDSGIYRCAQPNKRAFSELSQMGITTVINLRYFETDKRKAENTNLQLFHIKMRANKCKDDEIVSALRLIKNRQGSIAIHCKHGADRTGLLIALYRIAFQGWSKEDAIEELTLGNYNFHPVFSNIPQYIRDLDVENLIKKMNEAR